MALDLSGDNNQLLGQLLTVTNARAVLFNDNIFYPKQPQEANSLKQLILDRYIPPEPDATGSVCIPDDQARQDFYRGLIVASLNGSSATLALNGCPNVEVTPSDGIAFALGVENGTVGIAPDVAAAIEQAIAGKDLPQVQAQVREVVPGIADSRSTSTREAYITGAQLGAVLDWTPQRSAQPCAQR